jgi:acyl-CoA thioester hydrolase
MRESTSTVRVRYAETDQMGIVYYANYLVWFEIARTDWLRATGWTYRAMEHEGFALPVIEAHCDYKSSARYDDEIAIVTKARLVSGVRLAFDYTVSRRPTARSSPRDTPCTRPSIARAGRCGCRRA